MSGTGKKFGTDRGDPFNQGRNPDEIAASRLNPALGADPTLNDPAAGAAPVPEARLPSFTPMPAPGADPINDDDLLTDEEMAHRLAGVAGLDPVALGLKPYQHDENLAETLEDSWLKTMGQTLLERVEADLESRKDWEQRFTRGLEILGLKDFIWEKGTEPFEGASNATLPMLAEAVMQSQARFEEEVFPAAGPAKTVVMGDKSPEKEEAKDRVSDHMNYQLTLEDRTYFMESQKLGLYLPIYGCGYRKGYHDFVEDRNVLRFIPGVDMILPYNARSLESSPRKTHRFKVNKEDFAAGVAAGAYRQCDLEEPPQAEPDQTQQEIDKLDDKVPVEADGDEEWTFYEMDCKLTLPSDADMDEQTGQKTGLALPYTVTFEEETGEILAIRRCWKQNDPLKKMRLRYAEYWYMPGLGSMGTGLIHWIGGLSDAATDALRAFLDSATWANLQGGFKAKDSGAKAGEMRMKPGAWIDVDMTADELDRAFHTPPVREPSDSLFKILGFLVDLGRRFASTTDMMVGDQDSKGAPVGTTIALIEQGSKIYSGVHKRAHFACGVELQILFDLNAEYIPEEGYPYQVPGNDRAIYRADYDTKMVSVVPVSDPNIFSQTQRIALAQTRYQISQDNPAYFNKYETLKSLLKSFKDPEVDTTLVNPDEVPWMDPVSENVSIVTMRPVKAKDGENHDAHLAVHMAFAQHPQFGGLPQAQAMIGPAMMAHIAEHVALKYAATQRALGVPVPPLNLSAPPGTPIAGEEQPQQTDAIAQLAGMMVGQFMQTTGLSVPPDQAAQDQAAQAEDSPEKKDLMKAQTWAAIAAGLASMAKAGMSLEQAEAAAASIEAQNYAAGGAAPATGGADAPAPMGALGPTGPRPAAAAPAPKRPTPQAPAATPGMPAVKHDENLDGAPAHQQNVPQP